MLSIHRHNLIRSILTALVIVYCGIDHVDAQSADARQNNWHQWRGPDANGVSPTGRPPIEWNENKNIQWKVPIAGAGSSTPIIWQNRVFILTAVNTGKVDPSLPKPEDQPKRVFGIRYPNTLYEFFVLCLDRKTGKEIWRQKATEKIPHEGHHNDCDFAPASPTTDGNRLYCWFGSAGLFCYDLDGRKLWERNPGKAYVGPASAKGVRPSFTTTKSSLFATVPTRSSSQLSI